MTISSIYDLKSISRTPVADLGSGTPLKKFLIRDYISIESFRRIRDFFLKNRYSGFSSSFEYDSIGRQISYVFEVYGCV